MIKKGKESDQCDVGRSRSEGRPCLPYVSRPVSCAGIGWVSGDNLPDVKAS